MFSFPGTDWESKNFLHKQKLHPESPCRPVHIVQPIESNFWFCHFTTDSIRLKIVSFWTTVHYVFSFSHNQTFKSATVYTVSLGSPLINRSRRWGKQNESDGKSFKFYIRRHCRPLLLKSLNTVRTTLYRFGWPSFPPVALVPTKSIKICISCSTAAFSLARGRHNHFLQYSQNANQSSESALNSRCLGTWPVGIPAYGFTSKPIETVNRPGILFTPE